MWRKKRLQGADTYSFTPYKNQLSKLKATAYAKEKKRA
jgi:hypothetical protein